MDFLQVLVGDVGIDLGGGDRGMTEHGLDRANVGSIYEQICCKAVA